MATLEHVVGSINERGFLASLYRKGFTHEKCLMEMAANGLDALDTLKHDSRLHKKLGFHIYRDSIRVLDNGIGMDAAAGENMFAMHRENHAGDTSRGVSGLGAKAALSILSGKTIVHIYTRTTNGEYLCFSVPWDIIHSKGVYTDMVTIRPMTEDEEKMFQQERQDNQMCGSNGYHGTTIKFLYNDALKVAVEANFMPITSDSKPLDRVGIVFGRESVECFYKHYEDGVEVRTLDKYNYFDGTDADFYLGKSVHKIEQYCSKGKPDRFIWDNNGTKQEINPSGRGYAKEPDTLHTSLFGYTRAGTYDVTAGLRVDTALFDPDHPELPTASKNIGTYNATHLGEECSDFLCSYKLVRNGQLIGLIPPPDVKVGSARAGGRPYVDITLTQCDISFCPVSSQDNPMDHAMNIQENKNQYDGSSVTKKYTFTRLVAAIKRQKVNEIWEYFESKVVTLPTVADISDAPVADVTAATADVPAVVAEVPTVVAEVPAVVAEVPAVVAEVPAVVAEVPAVALTPILVYEPLDEISEDETSAMDLAALLTPISPPVAIDVMHHRRGVVHGNELIDACMRLSAKINPHTEYADANTISLFNQLINY